MATIQSETPAAPTTEVSILSEPAKETDMSTVAKSQASITQTPAISMESLPPVGHGGVKVLTTELLANLYGTTSHSITKNHRSNSGRFVCGKHYFKIEGSDLKEFKNKVTNSDLVANRAKHLILWTERGAARHAKMLETDQAWEVFEQLEDCYFSVKAAVEKQARSRKSSTDERTPLRQYVEKMIASKSGMTYPDIWGLVHERFDVQHINQLSASESLEAIEYLKTLEGEWLGKESLLKKARLNIDYPGNWWLKNCHEVSSQNACGESKGVINMSLMTLQRTEESALGHILFELRNNDYNVDAGYIELKAMKHHLEVLTYAIETFQERSYQSIHQGFHAKI